MVRVADAAGLRSELIARGRAWATQFTWERTARAVTEVYREAQGRAGFQPARQVTDLPHHEGP